MRKNLPAIITFVLSAVIGITLSVMGSLRYQAGNAGFYDLGIMEQIAWNLGFRYDLSFLVKGHLRPLFLIIAIVYRAFPRAETLIVIGSISVAAGGISFYFLGKRAIGPWAGFFLSVFYLLHPGTWYLALFDFHPDALFPLIVSIALIFLEGKRPWPFLAFSLSPLLLKETLALPIAVLGIVAFIKGLKKQGAIIAAVALVWFLIASFWLVPAFNPQGPYTRFFGPPSLSWAKVTYWLFLMLPLGLLPILRPLELLPGLVHSGLIVFAAFPGYYGIETQYAAQFLPFGLWATAVLMSRVNWRKIAPLILGFSFLGHALFAPTPFGIVFYRPDKPFNLWIYQVTKRDQEVTRAISERVPRDVSLCAQINLITGGVPQRARLWPFPEGLEEAQYVLLDTATGRWVGMNRDEEGYRSWASKVLSDPAWEIIYQDGEGLFVLRRIRSEPSRLSETLRARHGHGQFSLEHLLCLIRHLKKPPARLRSAYSSILFPLKINQAPREGLRDHEPVPGTDLPV